MRIGLTGGIGSGKSTVAAMFVEFGATLVDTDAIARQITLPGGEAIDPIVAAFGPAVLDADGGLDRAAMRAHVFNDAAAKQQLEAILHPMIGIVATRQAAAAKGSVVFDVPLLAESLHWRDRVDRVLVIDCTEATQVARVVLRPGWTEAAARAVVAQQATRAARRACADAVIYNEALTIDALREEVALLCRRWEVTR
ncbi:MAG: dephospho-CoA kinase [Rhizobacter sp.]|jgi:dephospho-CoA kinase|nr:dephospho-CoA kinase [Rhizobacter sp.]